MPFVARLTISSSFNSRAAVLEWRPRRDEAKRGADADQTNDLVSSRLHVTLFSFFSLSLFPLHVVGFGLVVAS